ncbi:MAG: hypothetical protein KME23_13165 [Goleter apudmare HA4340-LM2]|jgi:hypothetical protein|nr:hypothetical protein [Goleter apudmare HA4340-LM2]
MKFNKIAIALITASASVFSFGSVAAAGEGGAAGAVSATLSPSGVVLDIAAAGAVGKNDAAATASVNYGIVSASALGSAGSIQLLSDTGEFDGEIYNEVTITGSRDTTLGTSQSNSIATFTETPIGTVETGF